MKFSPEDLNFGHCLSQNTYTCGVTIAPRVCDNEGYVVNVTLIKIIVYKHLEIYIYIYISKC